MIIQANSTSGFPLADSSVQCVVTSPPYWGLRDYGIEGQIGLERTPQEYVERIVEVFREVWRVLRNDGTVWLNLGDSYAAGGRGGGSGKQKTNVGSLLSPKKAPDGLKPKDLVGIPWHVALALQAGGAASPCHMETISRIISAITSSYETRDEWPKPILQEVQWLEREWIDAHHGGWYLRSDIIWCLSGGAWLYARTQKGDMPIMVRDLARLDPATVKLWNGEKWTQLLGMNANDRDNDGIELVLRSGERISCTSTHKFPTSRGLLPASEIREGDTLETCTLPEPDNPRDCAIDRDAAWFAGLYLAEGSRSGSTIQIAGHTKETARWDRVQRIAAKFGGSASKTDAGNTQSIRVYGRVLHAIIDELVAGRVAKDKGFSPVTWRYSNAFVAAMLDGYLSGDGHFDAANNRWRLGFTRNYNLERDLRTACARLGYVLTLKPSTVKYDGHDVPTFRGEIRMTRSGHHNERDRAEVVEIRKARYRKVYDLGVEDEPHVFALASGILTHNSKPNPMPESVTDRPTKAHEYLFLLSKAQRYYYDHEAIAEPLQSDPGSWGRHTSKDPGAQAPDPRSIFGDSRGGRDGTNWGNGATRNRRDVWTIPTTPSPEAHFAVFPEKLVEPCILAGSAPGDLVLDPFGGTGTTVRVAQRLWRKGVALELSAEYCKMAHDKTWQTARQAQMF